jgi:hypothetical protein
MSKRNWTMLVLAILLVLFCFTMARAESSHKIYPEGEGLNIVNRSDKPIYVFYSIYQWGCNSSLVAGPDPDTGPFVQGL